MLRYKRSEFLAEIKNFAQEFNIGAIRKEWLERPEAL